MTHTHNPVQQKDTRRAFTLVEVIVVMAVMAVLVLLAAPRFAGVTKDAQVTAMIYDARALEDAVEWHRVQHSELPKQGEKMHHTLLSQAIGKGGELYTLDAAAIQAFVTTPTPKTDDYLLVAGGTYDGAVLHREGVLDEAGRLHVGRELVLDDTTTAPGPKTLFAGTPQAGFFGVVPARDLFSGDELAQAVGLTAGIAHNDQEGWLKFMYEGKILFKSVKTYRHTISWRQLNQAGIVFGDKTVEKDGHTYAVRLMKGTDSDAPATDRGSGNHQSEWNRLMLPIHERAKNQNWYYKKNVAHPTDYWGTDFNDTYLNTRYVVGSDFNGDYQWCQERIPTGEAIRRGGDGVSLSTSYLDANYSRHHGWSPVLEYVEPTEVKE